MLNTMRTTDSITARWFSKVIDCSFCSMFYYRCDASKGNLLVFAAHPFRLQYLAEQKSLAPCLEYCRYGASYRSKGACKCLKAMNFAFWQEAVRKQGKFKIAANLIICLQYCLGNKCAGVNKSTYRRFRDLEPIFHAQVADLTTHLSSS